MDNTQCPHCMKVFSDRSGVNKHLRLKRCPVLIAKDEQGLTEPSNNIEKLFPEVLRKLQRLERVCDNLTRGYQKVIKENKSLRQMIIMGGNNTFIGKVEQTNNTININITSFGHEKLDGLDYNIIKKMLLDNTQNFIPAMTRQIHNNDELPEYQNIVYDSENHIIKYYDGLSWIESTVPFMTQKLTDHIKNNQQIKSGIEMALISDEQRTYYQKLPSLENFDPSKIEDQQKICDSLKCEKC